MMSKKEKRERAHAFMDWFALLFNFVVCVAAVPILVILCWTAMTKFDAPFMRVSTVAVCAIWFVYSSHSFMELIKHEVRRCKL